MIDDLVELSVVAAVDVEVEKAAKKHRWVRILRAIFALLVFSALVGLIYITVKYS
jgi:hypothetical protein